MKHRRQRLMTGLLVLLTLLLLPFATLVLLQNRLVFPAWTSKDDSTPPKNAGIEEVFFPSGGDTLHAWYLPAPSPKGHVVFHHGNGGNLALRYLFLHFLRDELNLTVLAYDYPGYGKSTGSPTEKNLLAAGDAATHWLMNKENLAPRQIIQYGESIGGAIAVDVASHQGARALVVEKTFDSLTEVAAQTFPYLPIRWFLWTKLPSADKIKNYHGPFFQVHSRDDTLVRFERGQQLFHAANQPKTFLEVQGINHNDPYGQDFDDALARFFADLK